MLEFGVAVEDVGPQAANKTVSIETNNSFLIFINYLLMCSYIYTDRLFCKGLTLKIIFNLLRTYYIIKKEVKNMKKFIKDFKKFITRGNILDMAVGVIIGGAFSKIVSSLVNDVLMPLISAAVGGTSVVDWKWVIKEATYDTAGNIVTAESALTYGIFLQAIIDFLLVALCLFIILKIVMSISNKMRRDPDGYTHEEYITLRKQGFKRRHIEEMEEEKIARAKAERAAAPAPETTDSILKDIRTLLQNQQPEDKDTK